LPAAGTRPARNLDGIDLLPVLSRKPVNRTLFWRYKRGDRVVKAVRNGNMKYVWDDGKEELQDLEADQSETGGLACDFAQTWKTCASHAGGIGT
jgi:hypothetical protein